MTERKKTLAARLVRNQNAKSGSNAVSTTPISDLFGLFKDSPIDIGGGDPLLKPDPEPTAAQVDSACLSFCHDFCLMCHSDKNILRSLAKDWLRAWRKEGFRGLSRRIDCADKDWLRAWRKEGFARS